MGKTAFNSHISKTLINWFKQNKRDLPWRETTDPYKIWVSEIILQQTRVNQGLNYYLRFCERFQNVAQLAEADEHEVLKYWQGLGYYSRARNLHKAAGQIMKKHQGQFPATYNEILELAGIGDYTAAAICSFAYNQPYATVDGNIYRVLSRLFAIETPIDSAPGKKEFALLAKSLLPADQPGLHNQAIMEFGALHCTPTSPDCTSCPLKNTCKAYQTDTVLLLPLKKQKTKIKSRFFNHLFVLFDAHTFLQKRTSKDVWQNLYELPLIETDHLLNPGELTENIEFKSLFSGLKNVEILETTNPMKHVLSHRVIYAQFTTVRINELNKNLSALTMIPIKHIDNFAVSRLTELFLERIDQKLFDRE